ncbi:unnamed protein product [Trichogramma brassicae]|uniref:Uncharacterized protein n=1 Tax=Trichogramma brassicae TaxID=86971 RepID=A0A6H5I2X8_9HYME|nr:unnamed protein product [Trichogramma brassicae]
MENIPKICFQNHQQLFNTITELTTCTNARTMNLVQLKLCLCEEALMGGTLRRKTAKPARADHTGRLFHRRATPLTRHLSPPRSCPCLLMMGMAENRYRSTNNTDDCIQGSGKPRSGRIIIKKKLNNGNTESCSNQLYPKHKKKGGKKLLLPS